jgi:predicted ArsR family transcriptional regulator
MQPQRRKIVDILKQQGPVTVEVLSQLLGITTVTVRHHLDVLRAEGLVGEPVVQHRSTSGRPQHVYELTEKADELFPRKYDTLANVLLAEIRQHCDHRVANVIFEGAVARLVADAPLPQPDEPMQTRVEKAVEFLNQKGYVAHWEPHPRGYVIHTRNCPFDGLASGNPELCSMDLRLMGSLMGIPLERVCHMTAGDSSCAYLAPAEIMQTS